MRTAFKPSSPYFMPLYMSSFLRGNTISDQGRFSAGPWVEFIRHDYKYIMRFFFLPLPKRGQHQKFISNQVLFYQQQKYTRIKKSLNFLDNVFLLWKLISIPISHPLILYFSIAPVKVQLLYVCVPLRLCRLYTSTFNIPFLPSCLRSCLFC